MNAEMDLAVAICTLAGLGRMAAILMPTACNMVAAICKVEQQWAIPRRNQCGRCQAADCRWVADCYHLFILGAHTYCDDHEPHVAMFSETPPECTAWMAAF